MSTSSVKEENEIILEEEEINLPKNFDMYVERKYMDWSIVQADSKTIVKFLELMGDNKFRVSSWAPKASMIKKASKHGILVMRNKRSGMYRAFPKNIDSGTDLTFNPDMLMVDEDESTETPDKEKL